jgi:3-deoxy-D-manno-octulosonate 8-phosphate phosphatase (KDO 8-P phosphatase)
MWHIPQVEATHRWSNIRALVFDWDGVFNSGEKSIYSPSGFFEADSMGVNMLRFSLWLRDGKMPPTAIITGADNPGAMHWTEREHPNALYSKVLNKEEKLQEFCNSYGVKPHEVAFFFDDILDLNAAKIAGLRLLINRPGASHFSDFCTQNDLVDFSTTQAGGSHGLREACDELLVMGNTMKTVIQLRMKTDGAYTDYLTERNSIITQK